MGSVADSVGSRTGEGSGADSVGSRTGAGSGADSLGSWTRAGSGTASRPYFVRPLLFPSTALTLLGMEFTRASQVTTGVLFHSSMTTSQSWWMLETLHSSTFHLRMPHRCLIGFRSGDMLGQSIAFNLSFFSKAVIVLEVCLGSLSCWNTALRAIRK